MTDTLIDAPTTARENSTKLQGSHIWYELMTTDPEGAKRFYDSVVGWNIGEPIGGPTDYRTIGRSDGGFAGGVLKLKQEQLDHGAKPAWMGYIGVDDVDGTVAEIEAKGGKALMPAFDIPQGRIAMVADPQGAAFYVMKPTPPAGQEGKQSDVFSVDQPQHVRWNELWSADPEQAVDFYTRQFGWSQEGDMDMGEMGKYRFIQHNGVAIGAIMPKMPDVPASMWNFYIGVDDIDRAADAVRSGGGKLFQDPMEIPGGEFAINGADPDGALFGLVGPRKK